MKKKQRKTNVKKEVARKKVNSMNSKNPKPIKYVLFDWDDTLADTTGVIFKMRTDRRVLNYFKKYNINMTFNEFRKTLDKTVDGVGNVRKRKVLKWVTWMDLFFNNAKLKVSLWKKTRLLYDLNKYLKRNLELRPGVVNVLNFLKRENVKIILVTNSFKFRVNSEMKKLNVIKYFDKTYFADKHSKKSTLKPFKLFLKNSLLKSAINPESCVMVGDDPVEDLAARKLGIKTILVDSFRFKNHVYKKYADYRAKDSNEVLKILKQLMGAK